MRDIWLNVNKFNKEVILTGIENGIKTIYVSNNENFESIKNEIKKLGRIEVLNSSNVLIYKYKNREDEDKIVKLSRKKKIILQTETWQIIPWENLIAKGAKFYIFINNNDELKQALTVLEKGVYGIIFNSDNSKDLRDLINTIKSFKDKITLSEAVINEIKLLSSGERVCIDTCNIMTIGEGMLVGNSSECLFLVHSESIENPYCDTRPFRVNAGAVHAYIKVDKDRTKYLSEIKSGDNILIVKNNGEIREGIVGRSKIETRPLILISAECEGKEYSVILQNAETINLVSSDKSPVSVTKLKKGDKVLVEINRGARHFGIKIEENIVEK
jgi:3-dehydroquinate synthase II